MDEVTSKTCSSQVLLIDDWEKREKRVLLVLAFGILFHWSSVESSFLSQTHRMQSTSAAQSYFGARIMAHATGCVVHDVAAVTVALIAPATTTTGGGLSLRIVVSCTWFGNLASFFVERRRNNLTGENRAWFVGWEFLTMTRRFKVLEFSRHLTVQTPVPKQ